MSFGINPTQYEGVQAQNPPGVIRATRAPTTSDLNHPFNTIWINTSVDNVYIYTKSASGVATWIVMGSETNAAALQFADVTLTAAQVKGMRAAPVELVAAPATGSVIMLIGAMLKLDYGSEVFAETADNMAIRYTDGSGAIVSQAIESTGFIDQSADTISNALPKIDAIVTSAGSEAKSLVLHNTGDGEISGNASNDSTLTVRIYYTVQAL